MGALDGIEVTLREWGITVLTHDIRTGRPGDFTPSWVMLHHTGSGMPADGPAPNAQVVRDGRPDLAGPLCNLLVRRDHKVELISRGKANHAGAGQYGSIPTDEGNRYAVGIEIEHNGTSAEAWLPPYVDFCEVVAAATADHLHQPATRVCAHKEYAPTRKIDPYEWNMDTARREVAHLLTNGPTSLEDLMVNIPCLAVAAGQTQVWYVYEAGKRRVVNNTVLNDLKTGFGFTDPITVSGAALSLFPTLALDGNNNAVDAATAVQAQVAGVATQVSLIAADVADDATAGQVQSLAAGVADIGVAVSDDASQASVDELTALVVEALPPKP
jgi:hypothetical protein